jgi:hypothetical protein
VLGELASEDALLDAVRKLKAKGFDDLELYSPVPIEGAEELLGIGRTWLPALTLCAGLLGAITAYLIQAFCNGIDWPLVVGGHPPYAPIAFVPITFETGILCAAGTAFFGALWGSGLPRLSHPVFAAEAFESASQGGFWVSVGACDEEAAERANEALLKLGATHISRVRGEP